MFNILTLLNESVDTQEVIRMKLKEVCLALCETDSSICLCVLIVASSAESVVHVCLKVLI